MKTEDGKLYVVGGVTRSGKTAWTVKAVKGRRRVFAWDPEEQWCELPGWKKITRPDELTAEALAPGAKKIAYVAGGDLAPAFAHFCQAVFYSTRKIEPTDVIAEELADVTNPGKAPPHWGQLVRRGLKRGGNIYALSQRWQEADKTALSNASEFIFFKQVGRIARSYVEERTGIPEAEIPNEPLFFVRLVSGSTEIIHGKLTFRSRTVP